MRCGLRPRAGRRRRRLADRVRALRGDHLRGQRPGPALHGVPVGLPAALPVLPQPRHPDDAPRASARRHATSSRRPGATGPSSRRGGGLTVTGGEPLLQPAFVEDLFVGVKDAYGLHTALDTSANGGHRASERLLANTDLVLLDIKAGNAALYERVSGGGSLGDVLDFGARLVDHQITGLDPVRARPGPDRRAGRDRRGGRPGRRSRRASSIGSRSCPTTGSGSTSTPPSGAPIPLLGTPTPTRESVDQALAIFRERGLYALA